jgi:transcriptional regulator with XRE-family HTH domain
MAKPVTEPEALRQRLRLLAERFSQAEIARRTGISKANVHRYLKAGKVPADFMVDLTREFGLSPAWVLQGQGAMLASQVSAEAADESRKLLEVVLKLNAVGHEKLAVLQQDDAARGMRELADAIDRHEQLRTRLAQRAKPVAAKLLNEARDALASARLPEAEAALAAVARLDRMVNQPELTASRNMMEGTLATYRGDLPRQRRAHLGALGAMMQSDAMRNRQFLRTCYNYCAGLANAGRLHEAARMADAMLLLGGAEPPEWAEDWLLQVPRAYLWLHTGRLIEALPVLSRVHAGASDDVRAYVDDMLVLAHFLAGAPARLEGIIAGNELGGLLIALIDPSPETLAKLTKRPAAQLPESSRVYLQAARCIQTGKGKVEWPEAAQGTTAFTNTVLETELQRRQGKEAAARQACQQAHKQLAALEPETTPNIAALALHQSHAMKLLPANQAQKAQAWLHEHTSKGYLGLRSLV